jgi:hypothetical protein
MTITDGREEEHEEAGCKTSRKRCRFCSLRALVARFVAENTVPQMSDW